MLNIDRQIEILRNCECPKEFEVREICNKAKEIFDKEQNLVRVNAPVTVLNWKVNGEWVKLFSAHLVRTGG